MAYYPVFRSAPNGSAKIDAKLGTQNLFFRACCCCCCCCWLFHYHPSIGGNPANIPATYAVNDFQGTTILDGIVYPKAGITSHPVWGQSWQWIDIPAVDQAGYECSSKYPPLANTRKWSGYRDHNRTVHGYSQPDVDLTASIRGSCGYISGVHIIDFTAPVTKTNTDGRFPRDSLVSVGLVRTRPQMATHDTRPWPDSGFCVGWGTGDVIVNQPRHALDTIATLGTFTDIAAIRVRLVLNFNEKNVAIW